MSSSQLSLFRQMRHISAVSIALFLARLPPDSHCCSRDATEDASSVHVRTYLVGRFKEHMAKLQRTSRRLRTCLREILRAMRTHWGFLPNEIPSRLSSTFSVVQMHMAGSTQATGGA